MAALIRRLARAVAVAAVASAAPLLCAQTVTTLAGSGSAGFADGSGAAASFDTPLGLTIGPDGNLYVADALNFYIRKVSPAGDVTTFFGDGTWGYEDQHTF